VDDVQPATANLRKTSQAQKEANGQQRGHGGDEKGLAKLPGLEVTNQERRRLRGCHVVKSG